MTVWHVSGSSVGAPALGTRVAVVGHLDWVEFARVDRLPSRGEIVRARECWEELAGGGMLDVAVHAAPRSPPQRRAFVHVDHDGERTITVLGERMAPRGADALPWEALAGVDAVYFTGGDADALRAARAARVSVATARAAEVVREAGVELDALVASGTGERLDPEVLGPGRGSPSQRSPAAVEAGSPAREAPGRGSPLTFVAAPSTATGREMLSRRG
jgi:ribokinase